MLRLKLDLVIVPHRGKIIIKTGLRVFDKRSYFACYAAIVNGALGRHSKSSFYLTGYVLDDGQKLGDFDPDYSRHNEKILRKWKSYSKMMKEQSKREAAGTQELSNKWELIPYWPVLPDQGERELEWRKVFHPFFRSLDGELFLFLAPRVRYTLGITQDDVDDHVFQQNYGSHLPILP